MGDLNSRGGLPARHARGRSRLGSRSLGRTLLEFANEGVERGCEEETEDGHSEHPAEHGGAEGLPHLRTSPGRDGEREDAENERERCHQDRAKADSRSRGRGLRRVLTVPVLSLLCELDDQNRILCGQP